MGKNKREREPKRQKHRQKEIKTGIKSESHRISVINWGCERATLEEMYGGSRGRQRKMEGESRRRTRSGKGGEENRTREVESERRN